MRTCWRSATPSFASRRRRPRRARPDSTNACCGSRCRRHAPRAGWCRDSPTFTPSIPEISIQLTTSHDAVDFGRDDVDAAVQYGREVGTAFASQRLFDEVLLPVCSAAVADQKPALRRPRDVARHVLLHSIRRPNDWPDWFAGAGVDDPPLDKSMAFENSTLTYQGAVDGLGVAIAQVAFVIDEIERGRLVAPVDVRLKSELGVFSRVPARTHAVAQAAAVQRVGRDRGRDDARGDGLSVRWPASGASARNGRRSPSAYALNRFRILAVHGVRGTGNGDGRRDRATARAHSGEHCRIARADFLAVDQQYRDVERHDVARRRSREIRRCRRRWPRCRGISVSDPAAAASMRPARRARRRIHARRDPRRPRPDALQAREIAAQLELHARGSRRIGKQRFESRVDPRASA